MRADDRIVIFQLCILKYRIGAEADHSAAGKSFDRTYDAGQTKVGQGSPAMRASAGPE
jgi:hypothetical protein